MSKVKIAFVQINYKPAFFYNQIDMLIEPFGEQTSITQFTYPGSKKLKTNLKDSYISWIKQKVITIIEKAINLNVELLVFPEYSIPASILNDMVNVINNRNIIIVAGTHMVTKIDCTLPCNYPIDKNIIGCALCPVLTKDGIWAYTLKTNKAAAEINSLRIPKQNTENRFEMEKFNLHIKICIDAIKGGESLSGKSNNKEILVIPSWSKNTEPFQALAALSKYNEIPVIYVNNADTGGSVISGAFSKYNKHWFCEDSITFPIPKNTECMVTATINLDRMYGVVGTVHTEESIKIDEVVNIFYWKEETQKATIKSLQLILESKDNNFINQIDNACLDPILARKLHYLKIVNDNGLIEENMLANTLEYIKINNISLKTLMVEQSKQVLNNMACNMLQISSENEIYKNMSIIAKYIGDGNNVETKQTNLFDDDNLFTGRDNEIATLSQFLNSDKKVMLLHGIRGIGKSKLITNLATRVLPTPSPWEIIYIELEKGVGYDLLFDLIVYHLGLPYIEQKDVSISNIVSKIFEFIEKNSPIILVIDDIHNCTESTGVFSDVKIKDFIQSFISYALHSKKLKLILASNRRIPDLDTLGIVPTEVSRINDSNIRFIINYCYRKMTNSTETINIDDDIVNIIYGNPLSAILVAQLINEDKLQSYHEIGKYLHRYQERIIKNLLGEISLSIEENQLMKLLSVTKSAIEIEFVSKNYTHLMPEIDKLANRFLIESKDNYIKVHPLFKEFYYDSLDIKERYSYHKIFSSFYEEKLNNHIKKTGKENPIILSNVIYHCAGSLQVHKLSQYKSRYIEELKPVADKLYKDKDYENAIKYYRMIYDVVGNQRTDVLIRMAQAYFYCNDIANADVFFDYATKANPRGAYLWAQYSNALSSKKSYIKKAKELAEEAEKIYLKFDNRFNWELAKIKIAQAKVCRFENPEKAMQLYKEACDLDSTNTYYLCLYAKSLYDNGHKQKALDQCLIVKGIDPNHLLLKSLMSKLEEPNTLKNDSYIEEAINDEDI